MLNTTLKETIARMATRVQTPAQYMGGELNAVVKDHRQVRGKLCLAFPDTYTLGMSHHGLQVLYTLMNRDPRWACERAFTPWVDFESLLRRHDLWGESRDPRGRGHRDRDPAARERTDDAEDVGVRSATRERGAEIGAHEQHAAGRDGAPRARRPELGRARPNA